MSNREVCKSAQKVFTYSARGNWVRVSIQQSNSARFRILENLIVDAKMKKETGGKGMSNFSGEKPDESGLNLGSSFHAILSPLSR